MSRAKRAGLLRNAALVLGQRQVMEAVRPLTRLLDDIKEETSIRAASAWALGRIATREARVALERHREDADPELARAVGIALSHGE